MRQRSFSASRKYKAETLLMGLILLTAMLITHVYVLPRVVNMRPRREQSHDVETVDLRRVAPTRFPPPPPLRGDDDPSPTPTATTSIPTPIPATPSSSSAPTIEVTEIPTNIPPPRDAFPSSSSSQLHGDTLRSLPFSIALDTFYANLRLEEVGGNPEQPSKSFVDIEAGPGRGVLLPFDTSQEEEPDLWMACDPRNASFTMERDRRCQEYLRNTNNMRFINTMPSQLLHGRTIKMKVIYAHNNIQAIVKLSQKKFFYEAASEFLAYSFDRTLQFNRVPTTVYIPIPLDFLRSATSYSPLLSQWLNRFIIEYNYTKANFEPCGYFQNNQTLCAMAAVQLWMKDVHPALDTFLGLPFEYGDNFEQKYFVPGHELFQGTKRARLRAVGELLDRFVFDFLIGNTDRGMNNHNNFAYGGCSAKTECQVPSNLEDRIYGLAKYAYIDHGSSLHSHREPQDNPFFGDADRIKICRFRKSTYDHLKLFESGVKGREHPIMKSIYPTLPVEIFKVSHESVLKKTQLRLDKIVRLVEQCIERYSHSEVFSMPEYDAVRIAEEDATLPSPSFN